VDLGLAGRVALVVGGSRGIGRAVVQAFVDEGAEVVAVARNAEALAAVARETGCGTVAADVSTPGGVRAAAGGARELAGGVDCLVLCQTAAAEGATEEEYAASFATDLMPAVRLLGALREAQPGRPLAVCTIGSVDGMTGATPHHAYSTMKAALVAWTKNAAVAHGSEGTRVNADAPGAIEFAGGWWDVVRRDDPDHYAEVLARLPAGRLGRPQEVAAVVVFLCSAAASWVNGATVLVDGAEHKAL
jgi:NAD(P)-dependent dehydrogenase (short-subunit alcohol dehydrogenase family)